MAALVGLLVTALCVLAAASPHPPAEQRGRSSQSGPASLDDTVGTGDVSLTPIPLAPPSGHGTILSQPSHTREGDSASAMCLPGFRRDAVGMCREQW